MSSHIKNEFIEGKNQKIRHHIKDLNHSEQDSKTKNVMAALGAAFTIDGNVPL